MTTWSGRSTTCSTRSATAATTWTERSGSPRSIATFLQRVGRSGHALGARPEGRLFPTTRDELVECTALVRAVRDGRLDRIVQPVAPLDVLAQQLDVTERVADHGRARARHVGIGAIVSNNIVEKSIARIWISSCTCHVVISCMRLKSGMMMSMT